MSSLIAWCRGDYEAQQRTALVVLRVDEMMALWLDRVRLDLINAEHTNR